MKVKNVINSLVPIFKRAGRKINKNTPEILLGAGIISTVVGVVTACKATLKVNTILSEASKTEEKMENSLGKPCSDGTIYTNEDKEEDKKILKKQTIAKVIKTFIIPSIFVIGGLTLIISGHEVLKNRYLTVVSGYNNLMALYNSVKTDDKEEVKTDGKEEVKTSDTQVLFDEYSSSFRTNNLVNASHLKGALQTVNHKFRNSNEPLLMNDVLDALGIPRTKMGARLGWAKQNGDEFISFGKECDKFIEDCSHHKYDNVDAIGVMLDFNVSGIVDLYF